MAKPKHPDHDHDHDDDDYDRRSRGHKEESGDNPARHASIIERRWLGSVPPTPELYERALRQWQALPGAVARPAAAEVPPAEKAQPEGKDKA
jgi:hypothetical protein